MIGMQGIQDLGGRRYLGFGLGFGLAAALTMGCGPKYFQVPVQVRGKSGEAITSATLTPMRESYQGKNRDYPTGYQVNDDGFTIVDSLVKRDPIRVIVDFGEEQALYASDTLRIDPSRKYTPEQPFRFEADSVARVIPHRTPVDRNGDVQRDGETKIIEGR